MSNKCKKYTAAEKHFYKEAKKYQSKIRQLESLLQDYICIAEELKNQNNELQEQNHNLQSQVNKLLEYSNMTGEEVKAAIERDKKKTKVADMVSFILQSPVSSTYDGYTDQY